MTDVIYDAFWSGLFAGQINLTGTQIYCALFSGTYNPNSGVGNYAQRAHNTMRDITGQGEVFGTNYISGGQRLTGTYTTEGNPPTVTGIYDNADITWPNSTITSASGAIIYWSGGTQGIDKTLICHKSFGSAKSSSAGDFTITWSTSPLGILRIRQG